MRQIMLTIISYDHWNIAWLICTQHQHRFFRFWFCCRGCKRSCWSDCRRDIFAIVWVTRTSTRTIFLNIFFLNNVLEPYWNLNQNIQNLTNLAWTIRSAALKLSNTCIFAIIVIFTIINTSCQRHSIDIETFIPVGIFCNILKYDY